MGSLSITEGNPQNYICLYPFIHIGTQRDTVRVQCLAQEHNHYALTIAATTSRTS